MRTGPRTIGLVTARGAVRYDARHIARIATDPTLRRATGGARRRFRHLVDCHAVPRLAARGRAAVRRIVCGDVGTDQISASNKAMNSDAFIARALHRIVRKSRSVYAYYKSRHQTMDKNITREKLNYQKLRRDVAARGKMNLGRPCHSQGRVTGRAVVNGALSLTLSLSRVWLRSMGVSDRSPPFGLPSLRRRRQRPPTYGAPPRGGASHSVAYHAPSITACSLRQPREAARCFASLRPLAGCLPLRALLCRRHDGSEGMTRLTLQRNGGKGRKITAARPRKDPNGRIH